MQVYRTADFLFFFQSVAHCVLYTAKLGPMGFYKVAIILMWTKLMYNNFVEEDHYK